MKWIILLIAITSAGCSQQVEQQWREPPPDHFLELFWLSEEQAEAKLNWERENPPKSVMEYLLR